MMLRSLNNSSLYFFLVIEGLVEDQYKVFPRVKQVAVFCTCTMQFYNFVAKSCLLHVQLYRTLIYISVETSVSLYIAFQSLSSQLTSSLLHP